MPKAAQGNIGTPKSLPQYTLVFSGEINYQSALLVESILRRIDDPNNNLDIVICSPGGSANAAYKIARMLQEKSTRVRAIIPLYAKSAATLIALGTDEIIMGSMGELGPLDVQLEHPDKNQMISALDQVGALQNLCAIAQTVGMALAGDLRGDNGLSVNDAIEIAMQYTNDLIDKSTTSLDPILLNRSARALEIGHDYASQLLAAYMFKEHANREAIAHKIAEMLVGNYHEHSYVIDDQEAKHLGLKAFHANEADYPYMESLIDILRTIGQQVAPNQTFMRLLNENEVQYVCDDPRAIFLPTIPLYGDNADVGEETKAS